MPVKKTRKSKTTIQKEAARKLKLVKKLALILGYCLFAALMPIAVFFASGQYFGAMITTVWLAAVIVAVIFLVPSKWTIGLTPFVILGLWWAVNRAATEKMSLTDFPLMALDIRMFISNPSGLLFSIGSPKIIYILLYVVPCALAAACLYLVYTRLKNRTWRSAAVSSLWYLGKMGVIAAAFVLLYNTTVASTKNFVQANDSEFGVWSGDGLIKFAKFVGVIPFIIYSDSIEAEGTKSFLSYQPKVSPPSDAAILTSTSKYLNLAIVKPRVLPNIILIHAESTFDPNDVFNLAAPVNSELFYTTPLPKPDNTVQFRGPGLANIIGGGSWVSEFEIVNGIDSRLFGVAGRYTHASLSSYSHNSLATYLISRGYHATVSSPDSPLFYNAGVAYKRYGFERFHGETGSPHDDIGTMAKALTQDEDFTGGDSPFLKYVMLLNNHSPHPCDPAHQADYGTAAFAVAASDAETCALREYIRRTQETERAIADAKAFLEKKEAATGRPYVIAIYGDHQPYSFTGDGPVTFNMGMVFDRFRKDMQKRKTVIEIISSAENPFLTPFNNPIPFSLVSTMISAYVADSPDHLYLPENFYQFDQCGSDLIGQINGGDFYGRKDINSAGVCKSFDQVVSALKKSDIIGEKSPPVAILASVMPIINPAPACPAKLIRIAAAGSFSDGAPEISVFVDGKDIGITLLTDDHSTQQKAPLEMEKDPAAPAHDFELPDNTIPKQIAIRFNNDKWKSATEDRNVNIHSVLLDGQPLDPTGVSFSPPDAGWVNPHGVIQMFQTGSVIFNAPFPVACH